MSFIVDDWKEHREKNIERILARKKQEDEKKYEEAKDIAKEHTLEQVKNTLNIREKQWKEKLKVAREAGYEVDVLHMAKNILRKTENKKQPQKVECVK